MLCLILILILMPLGLSNGNTITVDPPLRIDCQTASNISTDAISLDTALDNLQNDTALVLAEGCYNLQRYRLIYNLTNITIQGSGKTVITCDQGISLAFFNIVDLKMEGIIVEGCSLNSNGYLREAISIVNKTLSLIYDVANNTKVAMFMADIYGLSIKDTTIQNNKGIGILAINLMGNSILRSIIFVNNTPNECEIQLNKYIEVVDATAGGLFLMYTDYKNTFQNVTPPSLHIDNSTFQYNQQCSIFSTIPLASATTSSPSIRSVGFYVGGGAGMGIVLSQFKFSVHIKISDSLFKENQALLGSVYIGQLQGSSGSNISFLDCTFKENGFDQFSSLSYLRSQGAAVSISLDIPVRSSQTFSSISNTLVGNTYYFHNVDFVQNTAYVGGGLYLVGVDSALTTRDNQNKVQVNSCTFRENSAAVAPAMYAFEIKYSGEQPGIQINLHDVTVDNNNGQVVNIQGFDPNIIGIVSMNMSLTGNCIFSNNRGSSLFILTSTVHFTGNITFENNTATSGGAILIYSNGYLVAHNNTSVKFINNNATSVGGAIYEKPLGTTFGNPCLLWFQDIDIYCNYYTFTCPNPAHLNIQIAFEGNNAPLGSAVYGHILSNCSWLLALQDGNSDFDDKGAFDILQSISNDTNNNFVFNLTLDNDRVVNTDAADFELLSDQGNSSDNPIILFPGQETNINISALDSFFQSVPLAITTRIGGSTNDRSLLGESGYWFLSGDVTTQGLTPITVYGNTDSNLTVSIYSVTTSASTNIYLELKNCSYGFVFENNSCVCDHNLVDQTNLASFECNATSGYITVPRFYWLGVTPAGEFTLQECIFDYCKPESITFTGEADMNKQCANNRADILCGKCAEGFSAVIGSSRCKKCDTNPGEIIGLIIAFLIAGIVLVIAIAFLNITVTEGYLNSVIFYANIIQFFIPTLAQIFDADTAALFTLISWINFLPGIELCIYNEMDTLTQTSLSFLFPGYLFLLMSIIICLARRSRRISKFGFSATRAFATLLLLCYSSVGTTCVKLLSFIQLRGNHGGHYVRWRFDPNVEYGRGVHGFLVFVSAVILLCYIIPFAFILATPPNLMAKTRFGRKLALQYKPIFDAFYNPFKERYSFWIGFRCIIRVIPLIIAGVSTYPTNVFSITVFALCFLLTHEILEPFTNKLQNKVETYFLINLLLFAVGTLYYPQIETFFGDTVSAAYIIGLVIFSYSGILFVGIIYIHIRFPKISVKMKAFFKKEHFCRDFCRSCCCCYFCCRRKKEKSDTEKLSEKDEIDFKEDQSLTYTDAPNKATYSELREPLLESGHAIVTTIRTISTST